MNWKKPPEIKGRRRDEQILFETGKYPEGKATVWGVTNTGQVIWKPVKTIDPLAYMGTIARGSTPGVRRQFNLIQFIINLFRRN